MTDLKAKLFAASEDLSLCLTANVYAMVADVQQNIHDALLKEKLKPVLPARSSIDHRCLEGTRKEPLANIMNWAKDVDTSSKLYHVHGVAGSGKSSMASTVCENLKTENLVAGAFFCKIDIPDQRDPNRVLPSLSYMLALRHEAYKKCVVNSLGDEPDISSVSLEQQLKVLFRDALAELPQKENDSKPFVFIIDALDECGDDVSRSRLAESLRQIAALTVWLKVFVTSRPTEELMQRLSSTDTQILSIDLNTMDAEKDIIIYTRVSLKKLVDDSVLDPSWFTEDTVQKLSTLAFGLFIWTSTMMKYVRNRLDKDDAMRHILSGKAATAEASLDTLYRKVIESSASDNDDLALTKTILGIVSITARNRPLSADGLYDFLQGTGRKVSKGILVAVINRLRSVLYEDDSKGNAIRVCHPSFLNFLEDQQRSGAYCASAEQMHAAMVEISMSLMKSKLRFNICSLGSSSIANKDVSDLPQKIKDNISESLLYSCLYWATHLTEANLSTIEVLVSEIFQSLKAIYWVEVLSLVDGLKIGLNALQSVMVFFSVCLKRCLCNQSIHSSSFVGK